MQQYYKPKNLKYVDIAIWIDNNIYNENCDDAKAFEYIYYLAQMLSHKGKFFTTVKEFDEFSIYFSSYMLLRYRDKRQYDDSKKLTKIKSVLNYMKIIAYSVKVKFQQEFYSQMLSKETDKTQYDTLYTFSNYMQDYVYWMDKVEFENSIDTICNTCKVYLSHIPYYGTKEWNNIYISCLLSLLSSFTLSNEQICKLNSYKIDKDLKWNQTINFYNEEKKNCVILYNLNSSMKDYIYVLVIKLRQIISNELSQSISSYIPPEDLGILLLETDTLSKGDIVGN